MKWPGFYTMLCVAVLGIFMVTKYQGMGLIGAANQLNRGGSGNYSSGSSGSHK